MKQFVELKKGFLMIEESCDPNYPGVYVSWVEKKTDIGQTICLIEDNEDDLESVKLHVWGCSDMDEPTSNYTIRKANWEGMGS